MTMVISMANKSLEASSESTKLNHICSVFAVQAHSLTFVKALNITFLKPMEAFFILVFHVVFQFLLRDQ